MVVEIWNKINAFECWVYRRVLKISWKHRVSNKEVLERMGIKMRLDIFVEGQMGRMY